MIGFRELGRRLSAIFRQRQIDEELAAELESHLQMATQDYMARGMNESDARRAAVLDLGGVQQAKELHRENRGLPQLEQLWRDICLAARSLRRDLSLSVFSTTIVALGVAASTLVFSVAAALLLRPLPFKNPEQLVWVANGTSSNLSAQTLQVDNLLELREGGRTLTDMAGFYAFYGAGDLHIDGEHGPQRITGVPITEGFLSLLGVEPMIGRGFSSREVAGREPVAILSHHLWRSRYGSDEAVIGRATRLNGEPTTIIGVLPETFDFEQIFTPGRGADLFLPFPLDARNNRRGNTLAVVGRLASDLSLSTAQDELTRLAAAIDGRQIERRNEVLPRLVPLHEQVSGDTRSTVFLLTGAVAILMLIVCANLSNLLLARATSRRKEMAIHMAMGAGRARLMRKLLFESLLLSALGTAFGVLLTLLGARWLSSLDNAGIPLLHQVQVDFWVLLFAGGLATMVGALFGILPALRASTTAPAEAMQSESRSTGSGTSARTRQTLVLSEIALACVLLVGVGLFLRSLLATLSTDLGFETQNVVALRVDLPRGFVEPSERPAYFDKLLAAVRKTPQVVSAGLTDALPLGDNFGWRTWNARAVDWRAEQDSVETLVRIVDAGYWQTLGLRLLAGRYIEDSDRSQDLASATPDLESETTELEVKARDRAVVVNETLAKLLWPQADDLSQVVSRRLTTSGQGFRVVGIVSEARYFNLEEATGPEMYFSFRQVTDINSMDLVMRTRGAPETALSELREVLTQTAPEVPLADFRTMDGLLDRATFRRRAVLGVLSGFGGFGLLLAVVGVYSVIAYIVAQNRRELGVRMAFGATRRQLCGELVRRTLRPVLLGAGVGLVCAAFLAKAVASQLYGVDPRDPLTFVIVATILVVSGVVAAYVPARRAAQLEVTEALREG